MRNVTPRSHRIFHFCFTTYYFCFLTCHKTDLGDSWMCRKHERTGQSNISVFWCCITFIKAIHVHNISVFWCCISFIKAIHVHNISLSALQKVQPRNAKTTRTLASVKYSQKELFDTVESEFTGSSDKFDVFWFQTALSIVERMLEKQLSRKILKVLNQRNTDDFTDLTTRYVSQLHNFVWYIDGHDKYMYSRMHWWIFAENVMARRFCFK